MSENQNKFDFDSNLKLFKEIGQLDIFQREIYTSSNFIEIDQNNDGNFDKIGGIPSVKINRFGWPDCYIHKCYMQFFFQVTVPINIWKQHIKLNKNYYDINNNVIQLFVCLKCKGIGQWGSCVNYISYDKCIPFNNIMDNILASFRKNYINEHYVDYHNEKDEEEKKDNEQEYQDDKNHQQNCINIYNYLFQNCYKNKTKYFVWLNNKDEYYLPELNMYQSYKPYLIEWKKNKGLESLDIIREAIDHTKWKCGCPISHHICYDMTYEMYDNLLDGNIKIGGCFYMNGIAFEIDKGNIITFNDCEQLPFMWGDAGMASINTKNDQIDMSCC